MSTQEEDGHDVSLSDRAERLASAAEPPVAAG